MIEIKNVSKTYNGNIKAIDNLNLKINDGEIVGFIGLNGAGKTTAIKMMTGILVPDTGTITINGYDIVKDSLKAKQIIGYIADNSPRDIYQRDLEETFGITRSTVSKNINLMVQKGLIVREGVAHDARLKKLVLTPKAWVMFEKMKRDSFEMEKRLTSGFSPEELKLLLQLIERMKQNMR